MEYVKRESIVIAWAKKNSLLLMNVHVLYVLEDKTSRKKKICLSVCLPVCLSVYVSVWMSVWFIIDVSIFLIWILYTKLNLMTRFSIVLKTFSHTALVSTRNSTYRFLFLLTHHIRIVCKQRKDSNRKIKKEVYYLYAWELKTSKKISSVCLSVWFIIDVSKF